MPNYEYLCENCNYNFEIHQSIKDDALVTCDQCGQDGLRRVIHACSVYVRQEAKTVIQQADHNERAMGKYELEDKRREVQEAKEKSKPNRPKPTRPWWRQTDKIDTDLAKLAPNVTIEKGKIVKSEPLSQKATDYIMTGKK